MPRRARPWVGTLLRSASSKEIFPSEASRRPITLFISVLLPAPLRPMRPTMAPEGTSSDTPRRICTAEMETLRFSTLSTLAYDVALYFRVGQRDRRRRIGDDAAVIEGEHALREAAHHLHVVLDEKDGRAFGAHRREDHLHDAELLAARDAARGLVEQQDARLRDHRQRDVKQLAHAAGQHLRIAIAIGGQAEALQDPRRRFLGRYTVTRHERRLAREEAAEAGVPQHHAEPDHHVLVHREGAVELRNLEGAADSEAGDRAGRQARNVAALELDGAALGLQVAGDHVDERRLAGAVGADQPDDRVLLDCGVYLGGGNHRAEALVQSLGVKNDGHGG